MEISIVGTSHIARESIEEVSQTLLRENPDIVAVELDPQRLYALQNRQRKQHHHFSMYGIKKVGVKGFLFALIGSWISQKLGKMVGVMPGEDMLTAIKIAQAHNLEVALIDQPIDITLKKLSQRLRWREKWHFITDLLKALFFKEKELQNLGLKTFDLRTVPSKVVIKKLIERVRERYPTLYSVLIAERNTYMAQRLKQLQIQSPEKKIVVVVGAGHEDEIRRLLHRIDIVSKT